MNSNVSSRGLLLSGGANLPASTVCCVEKFNKCPVGTKRSKRDTDHTIHLVRKCVIGEARTACPPYAFTAIAQDATISRQADVRYTVIPRLTSDPANEFFG